MRAKLLILLSILLGLMSCNTESNLSIKVNIDSEIVTINGKDFTFPIKKNILFELFGKPDKEESKMNQIYTWDKLGIWGFEKPGSHEIQTLSIQFNANKKKPLSFAPTNNFIGTFTLNDKKFNKVITSNEIKTLGFIHNFNQVYGMEGEVMGIVVWLLDSRNIFSFRLPRNISNKKP
jgi:hypothetical protein